MFHRGICLVEGVYIMVNKHKKKRDKTQACLCCQEHGHMFRCCPEFMKQQTGKPNECAFCGGMHNWWKCWLYIDAKDHYVAS